MTFFDFRQIFCSFLTAFNPFHPSLLPHNYQIEAVVTDELFSRQRLGVELAKCKIDDITVCFIRFVSDLSPFSASIVARHTMATSLTACVSSAYAAQRLSRKTHLTTRPPRSRVVVTSLFNWRKSSPESRKAAPVAEKQQQKAKRAVPRQDNKQQKAAAEREESEEQSDVEASQNWKIDLPMISTLLGISATIFLGFQQFASLQAGLTELKTEVRLIENSQNRRLDLIENSQNRRLDSLDSKIDKFFGEIQDSRRDVNSLRVETGVLKGQTDVLIKRP